MPILIQAAALAPSRADKWRRARVAGREKAGYRGSGYLVDRRAWRLLRGRFLRRCDESAVFPRLRPPSIAPVPEADDRRRRGLDRNCHDDVDGPFMAAWTGLPQNTPSTTTSTGGARSSIASLMRGKCA
ncbi:MAG: hypothetical protein WD051_01605 [Steroidobacteraceae bacterium]